MATQTTKRHPIRGFLYGIPFGLGLAMIAIGQKWAALGTWPPFILVVVGILVAMAWGMFGPAKAPKGPDPTASAPEPPPADPEPEAEVGTDEEPEAAPADAEALDS
jgi:hypothetical protein